MLDQNQMIEQKSHPVELNSQVQIDASKKEFSRIKDAVDPLEAYTKFIIKQYSSNVINESELDFVKNIEAKMMLNSVEEIKYYFEDYLYALLMYSSSNTEVNRIIWCEIDKYYENHMDNLKPFPDFLAWATKKFGVRIYNTFDPLELNKDRIMEVQNNSIKTLKAVLEKERKYRNRPDEKNLRDLVEQSRFINGKINYSKLAKLIGKTHPTAKEWCRRYDIS